MPTIYSATSGTYPFAGIWAPIVIIDSSDVSARIIGEIIVEAEEGAARIAEITIRPVAHTTFTIAALVGKTLSVQICDMASGTATDVRDLFTGIIDTPTLDIETGAIHLRASDNLQNSVEALTNSQVAALVPLGRHSDVVFDPAARGWSRLQDYLSTVPSSLDMTPAGVFRLTDWAPKVTPDLAFDMYHILDGSLAVSLASRNQMVNQVDIDFGYRFPRVKAESYPLSYSYVSASNISQHALNTDWWLRRDAVEAAIKSAGGSIQSITFTDLPTYTIGYWTPGPSDSLLCMGFSASVTFDYVQQIEEQHSITVSAPNSIAAVGTLRDRLSGALEGMYPPIQTAEHDMLLYHNEISGIPPLDFANPSAGMTTAADVTLTADTDRSAANIAMQTLIDVAKARIWASHRRNAVSASVPLNPDVDLDKTIDINVIGVMCRGKCRSVTHRMATDTGMATSEFSVAICSVAGTGVTHADTPTTAPSGSSPASTSLGSSATCVFNYALAADHIITVTFPGVAQAERDKANIALSSAYSAPLTEDNLTITL